MQTPGSPRTLLSALALLLVCSPGGPDPALGDASSAQDRRVANSGGVVQPLQRALHADPINPVSDTDSDLLPDLLEFVTHSDPRKGDTDGDGRSDFVEMLEHTSPFTKDAGKPFPDGFRLLLNSTHEGPKSQSVLWVHLLFRFTSGLISDMKGFSMFLDLNGHRYPITPLLQMAVADVKTVFKPTVGRLMRITLKLPLTGPFKSLTPCTFGAYTLVNNAVHANGSVLFNRGGIYYTLMQLGPTLVFQDTNQTSSGNPFWSSNKNCVFQLIVHGVGRGGLIAEVKKASCEKAQTRRCTTDCPAMKGQTFFVPDGLALILGG